MQKTAVIVSGALRHIDWASTSWRFKNADYFLVVDKSIQAAQSQLIIDSAYNHLTAAGHCEFISTTVLDDNAATDYSLLNTAPEHATSVSVKMAFKWTQAYKTVSILHRLKSYERVVLIRPDLFLWGDDNWPDIMEQFAAEADTVHSVAGISDDWNLDRNYPVMGDVLLLMRIETLEKLANFYFYFLNNYNLIKYHRYDIHSLLPKFLREHGISVKGNLSPWLTFNVLRPNMADYFDAKGLRPEVNPAMLINKQQEWWKNKYGG
jgi:hypothetical protein